MWRELSFSVFILDRSELVSSPSDNVGCSDFL